MFPFGACLLNSDKECGKYDNIAWFSAVLFLALASAPEHPKSIKEVTGDTDAPSPIVEVVKPSPTPSLTPPKPDKRPELLRTFQSYVGIKEQPLGSNNGLMVDKFNASCGLSRNDHAPWCASVVNYAYQLHGLKGRGAYSPSWFVKSRVVQRNNVQPVDVALVYFPSKGRYAHTIAAIEKVTWSAGRVVQVTTLEGNTNAQGSREGDQFARRVRAADTLTFVRWHNQ